MKFKKRPVVIEAHRIGDDGWPGSIWEGVKRNQIILHLSLDYLKQVVGHVEIYTLEGVMRGEVGDWIIQGVEGEFYSCKPDIFEKTYEPVKDFISEEQIKQFNALSRPLIEWLNKNWHPHVKVIIEPTSAELVEGISSFRTFDYVRG